ncbi:MAG: sporulation protein YhbH [Symbiobacteriia bacterium]
MFTSRTDWSLHRKGPVDQARHNQKIREAIRENLGEIISEENIITSDGDRVVKVPIRSLEQYKFRFDPYEEKRLGQGEGKSKVGDVIGRLPQDRGKGSKAGDRPGTDYFEVEMTIDELAELIFEDLGLPNLRPKAAQEVESDSIRFTDVRRKGAMGNLDKRRTILENIRRNALSGEPVFRHLNQDDLRFKTWVPHTKLQSNAVVLAMRDVSGSMGEFKKYLTRSLFFWMIRFLRTRYVSVEIVFIVHHTDAKIVDEDTFFKLGESGGTKVSSAYALALDTIKERFEPVRWNIYPFHFSDGDNWGEADNRKCLDLLENLLAVSNFFGYGEIREDAYTSTLMTAFAGIKDPKFVPAIIHEKKDVYPALKRWFTPGGEES